MNGYVYESDKEDMYIPRFKKESGWNHPEVRTII